MYIYDCIIRISLKCVYLRNSTPPVLMIAALATAENAASKSMTALRILLQYKVIIYSACVCVAHERRSSNTRAVRLLVSFIDEPRVLGGKVYT